MATNPPAHGDRRFNAALIFVGGCSIVLAMLGMGYAIAFRWSLGSNSAAAWLGFLMAYDIALKGHLTLAVIGIQLVRLRSEWAVLIPALAALESVFFGAFAIVFLAGLLSSRVAEYVTDAVAAAVVGSAGLQFPWWIGFPLWGSALAIWAHRGKRLNAHRR